MSIKRRSHTLQRPGRAYHSMYSDPAQYRRRRRTLSPQISYFREGFSTSAKIKCRTCPIELSHVEGLEFEFDIHLLSVSSWPIAICYCLNAIVNLVKSDGSFYSTECAPCFFSNYERWKATGGTMRERNSSSRWISLLYPFHTSLIEDIGVFLWKMLENRSWNTYKRPTTSPVITSDCPIHGGSTLQQRPSISSRVI